MSKSLDDLSPEMKSLVSILLNILKVSYNMDITIVDTLRTPQEQAENIKKGVSWTKNSKHLPDSNGKSNAIDIVPTILIQYKNWAPASPLWQIIGHEAKTLGLKWGGDWTVKDMGHLELA